MNRQERRRAARRARHQQFDRRIAVHEAGHVVGRILVAESLGWKAEEAVLHIDVYTTPTAMGEPQATTYGKLLSRPMQEFLDRQVLTPLIGYEDIAKMIPDMRAAGIDVDWWRRAKIIETIFGPMAEARFIGCPFDDLFSDDSAAGDLQDVIRYGQLCGLTSDVIVSECNENITIAEHYIERPQVWLAVTAVADRIKPGRMPGRVAAQIVAGHIG